ncbi:hypothetical protein HY249_01795, partial [Candidatus Azambacteria bacterium]|nr:hypothetical protein [Candidatus Azambacteria bacterium]
MKLVLFTIAFTAFVVFSGMFDNTEAIYLVLGAFIGFALNIVAQNLNKADIEITVLKDSQNIKGSDGERVWKFLHVKVTNKKRSAIFHSLIGSKISLFTRARIKILDPYTQKEIFSIDGRWSTDNEQSKTMIVGANVKRSDGVKVQELRFEHIFPGESSNLAIAVKIDGQENFYGFSNLSVGYDVFQNSKLRLDESAVFAEVEV